MTKKYPAPTAHDKELEKVTDDVYVCHGCFKMGPGIKVSNSMTIVRRDGNLTLFNCIRVKDEMEAKIKALGTIQHIVRLSSNHGAADTYWVDTNPDAKYWDIPGAAENAEKLKLTKVPATENILEDEGELPGIPGSKFLLMHQIKMPDSIGWIPDGNGILLPIDFVQDARPGAPHESFIARKVVMPMMSFGCMVCTPKPYMGFQTTGEEGQDLAVNVPRVMALEFDTIIPAHGRVMKGDGKTLLKEGWRATKEGKVWKCPKIE